MIFIFAKLMKWQKLDLIGVYFFQELCNSCCVFQRSIKAWNHRDPWKDIQAVLDSPFEISDDLFIADSGSFLMLSGIIMFYIKQQQIKLRGQILKDIIRNITGSFNGSMDIVFFKRNSSAFTKSD